MMARMPELSSRLTSPTLKPSRLSISSCDRTRSPPFLPVPKSLLPSSTMAAHCRAMFSESSLDAASAASLAGSAESSDASHCAAIASWSTGSLPAMFFRSTSSLNDDFLEQNRVDLVWRNRRVDAPRQIFLEAKQARRTGEVGRTQFAQVGLEDVGHPRQRRLDSLGLLLFLDLEDDLGLEILHPLSGEPDQVHQHVRHFDIGQRLRRRRLRVCGPMSFLAVTSQEKEPGRPAARDGEHGNHSDDQLEFAFGRRRRSFCCAFLLVVRHRPPRSDLKNGFNADRRTSDAIQRGTSCALFQRYGNNG